MKFQRISDWSRRHPVTTGGVGFLVAVILIFLAFDSYTRIRLASEIRTLERMGIPCNIREAAELQQKQGISQELTREFRELCNGILTDGFSPVTPPTRMELLELEDLPKFLVEHGQELRAADRFLDEHPDLILWHDYSGDFLGNIELPELNLIRRYVRLNHDRFYYALLKNDPAEAVRNFDRSAILCDYLLRDRFLICYLVAITVETIRLESLYAAAFDGNLESFDAATLKRWADSMVEVESRFRAGFPRALAEVLGNVAEVAQSPQYFCQWAEMSEWEAVLYRCFSGPIHRQDGVAAIRAYRRMLLPLTSEDYTPETVRKLTPYCDLRDSRMKSGAAIVLFPVTNFFLLDASSGFQMVSSLYTRCRVVRTGLAVELFLRKYGRIPQKLNELVPEFLPAVPVSPFSGNPLRIGVGTLDYYRPETKSIGKFEGYRVYADGDPERVPVGLTRTDRYGRIPVWNRAMKLPGGEEGKE